MSRNTIRNEFLQLCPVEDFSVFAGFFCCDKDDDLDDFIHNHAERHLRDKMAVTYGVYFLDPTFQHIPVAFVTLQNDAIKIKSSDYPYKASPAVKIGRFGVRVEFQDQGLGTNIITLIKTFMCTDNRTGCRFITLDAYNQPRVIKFYTERNGFKFLKKPHPNKKQELLFFDLAWHEHH